MAVSTHERKFYLRAPALEFSRKGPISIGNVITNMTLPQDPITEFKPLAKIISGAAYSKGQIESEHHVSVNAGLSTKIYSVFGGQAEAKGSSSLTTTYAFDKLSALFLEKNPTIADVKAFREEDEEFRNALRNGPVYIVTGLKIAHGLRYSNQQANERNAALSGGGHVTQEAAVEGRLGGDLGGEEKDSWTALGDLILAYRLHIVKKEGWKWRGEHDLMTRTHDPGDAGFMSRDDVGEVKLEIGEVVPKDVGFFAKEQECGVMQCLDLEDDEGIWSLAVLEER